MLQHAVCKNLDSHQMAKDLKEFYTSSLPSDGGPDFCSLDWEVLGKGYKRTEGFYFGSRLYFSSRQILLSTTQKHKPQICLEKYPIFLPSLRWALC